jgi:hypothetical protein
MPRSELSGLKASFSWLIHLLKFLVRTKVSSLLRESLKQRQTSSQKAASSATIKKCDSAAAVKLQNQRIDVSDIPKGNKEMVVHAFAVLMVKSPGVVSVISAFRMAPPAVTEVDSDGNAKDDKNRSQEALD